MCDLLPASRTLQSRLRERVARILAQRDHSEQELRRKLAAPFPAGKHSVQQEAIPASLIEETLAWCYEHHWLDDARFARRFLVSRWHKGYGPKRIIQELRQKGVTHELCETTLREVDLDWGLRAREIAERKFGTPLPVDYPGKAKLQRFLLYRGFYIEDIQAIYLNFTN